MRAGLFLCAAVSLSVSLAVLAPGCGGSIGVAQVGSDSGASDRDPSTVDARSDRATAPLDAGEFCTGPDARVRVNGAGVPVLSVTGKALAMNCCDSAELVVATGAFQALLAVMWRVQASRPGAIDVGNLPQGSSLEVDLGCDPLHASCDAGGEDRYTSGFQGTIDYAPGAAGVDASYCFSVAEPAGSPHGVLHSLQIYAPHVASSY